MSTYYSPQPSGPSAFAFLQPDGDDLLNSVHSLYTTVSSAQDSTTVGSTAVENSASNVGSLYGPPTPPLSYSGSTMGVSGPRQEHSSLNHSASPSSSATTPVEYSAASNAAASGQPGLTINTSLAQNSFMPSSGAECGQVGSLYSSYTAGPTQTSGSGTTSCSYAPSPVAYPGVGEMTGYHPHLQGHSHSQQTHYHHGHSGYSPATAGGITDYHSPAASYASLPSSYSNHHHQQHQHQQHQYSSGTPTSYTALWNTPPPSSELPQLSFSPLVEQASVAGTGPYTYAISANASSAQRPPSNAGMLPDLGFGHGVGGLPLSPLMTKHMPLSVSMSMPSSLNRTMAYPGLDASLIMPVNTQVGIGAGHSGASVLQARTSLGRLAGPRAGYSRSIVPNTPTSTSSLSSVNAASAAGDLRAYGYLNDQGTWSCAYPNCTSKAVFTRGCDLRKHYKRHTKTFFCQHEGCPQARGGGFSSRKDLARHEAKHNPGVRCEWPGCERIFSRVDNMRDHVKRIHHKAARQEQEARRVGAKAATSTALEVGLPGVVVSSGGDAVSSHHKSGDRSFLSRSGPSGHDYKIDYASTRRVVLPSVTLPSMSSTSVTSPPSSSLSNPTTLPGLSSVLGYSHGSRDAKPVLQDMVAHPQSLLA